MNKLIWNLLRIRVDKVLGYKSGTLGYCISERERESYRKVFGSFKSQKDTAWKKLIDS